MLIVGAGFPILLCKILGISGENILTIFMFLSQRSPSSETNTDAEYWISQHHNSEKKKAATYENLKGDYECKRETSNTKAVFYCNVLFLCKCFPSWLQVSVIQYNEIVLLVYKPRD